MEVVKEPHISLAGESQRFTYPHLMEYARYLCENKLQAFVDFQIDLSYELKVPVLKYFTHLSREQITELSLKSNGEFLQSIANGNLKQLIEDRFNAWKTNQIPMLTRDQLVSEDLTLGSYIRKKAFALLLKSYTDDVEKAVAILDDVDKYILETENMSIRFFIDLQQEKINEQLQIAKQNEALYKEAESLTHIGNWTWNIAENNVKWSDEMFSMLDLEPQSEIITFERFTSFIHPDDKKRVVGLINQAIENKIPLDFYHRLLLPSDVEKHVHVIGKIETDESGNVIRLHGTRQDVTDQKLLENQLVENQTFVQKIADVTPSIIAAYNIHSAKYIFINDALNQLLGYDSTEVEEKGVSFFTDLIHPDDLGLIIEKNNMALAEANENYDAKRAEPIVEFIYRMRHKDGKYRWFHTYGTIFDRNSENQVEHLLNISVDITEEYNLRTQLAEEKLFAESLTENSPQMIMAYDRDMRITVWNKESEKHHGLTKEDVLGKNLLDIFPRYKIDEWMGFVNEVFGGKTVHIPKIEFLHGKGWGECYMIPLQNKSNEVSGLLSIISNITSRVEATILMEEKNKELQKQKDFIETIVDSSVDVICVFDKDMRYLTWNKKAEEIYGQKRELVVGKKIDEVFTIDKQAKVYTDIIKGLNGETIHNLKVKSAVLDRYFENYIVPLYDDKNEVYGVLTIAHDNTDIIKNSELLAQSNIELEAKIEELRRSDERFHKMTEEVQDYAIILLDKDGNIEKWNKGAEKIKGYKSAEIIGKHFSIFYLPKDREEHLPQKLLQEAVKKGRVSHAGWRLRKNGTTFWGSVVLTSLHDSEKNITGFSKVTHDLTEKKLAEDNLMKYTSELEKKNRELEVSNEKLVLARKQLADDRMRYLIEKMPHIVATARADGSLEYSNQNLTDFTGLSFNSAKNNNWFEAIHPSDIDNIVSIWQQAFNSGEDLNAELRLRRTDGEYLWHLAIARPLKDEDGRIFLWLFTLTNINDQKLIEENKDEFIGIASHELKTPLTSAKAYMQLVQTIIENDEHKNAEAFTYVRKANVLIDKLNLLISELLDITKIQNGKLHLNIVEFDISEIINENIEFIQASSKHKITVVNSKAIIVRADKERIQQVMFNLLSNAIKYSPDANVVNVSIEKTAKEVIVIVRDEGIGIPRSDLEKVFERFYRVESDGNKFQGLGIGLYISAEIIKRHNGKIWVESEPAKGSSFYFSLPLYTVL